MSAPPWETFVREHFPGYLLPASARSALSAEEAARFLSRLTGRPHELSLLRAASLLSPRLEALHDLAFSALPELARSLPSSTEILRREWEGGFQGQLDTRATLACWASGRETTFVTRSRRRSFALPENVLVRAVASRLLEVLVDLRQARLVGAKGWGEGAEACEGQLRHLLGSTVLREIPDEPIGPTHEQAAFASRHPCHRVALDWHRAVRAALDDKDPAVIARVVAEGALSPIDGPTRFELAVVIRLVMKLWEHVQQEEPGVWTLRRCLVRADRREVAAIERGDGARVSVFYNQSHLGPGPGDLGARHYFGHTGRMRPDITVVTQSGAHRSATIIEVKETSDPSYMLQGFHETLLYRLEYAEHLRGLPKAVLVTSADVRGALREGDEVMAVGWKDWVPESVLRGLLRSVLDAPLGAVERATPTACGVRT